MRISPQLGDVLSDESTINYTELEIDGDAVIVASVERNDPAPSALEVLEDHTERYDVEIVDEATMTKLVEVRLTDRPVRTPGEGESRDGDGGIRPVPAGVGDPEEER